MREYDAALHWLRDMQPTLICFYYADPARCMFGLNSVRIAFPHLECFVIFERQRIERKYKRLKALKVFQKKDRQRQIDSAKGHAEKLREILHALPQTEIWCLDEDGRRDYMLAVSLQDDLDDLIFRLKKIELHDSGSTQGWAEDYLVRELARLCPDSTCNLDWSLKPAQYTGPFVDFLVENLPHFEIPKIKAQAFAQRYLKL